MDSVFADPRLRLRAVEVPIGPAGGADAVTELVAALDRTPLAGASRVRRDPGRPAHRGLPPGPG